MAVIANHLDGKSSWKRSKTSEEWYQYQNGFRKGNLSNERYSQR